MESITAHFPRILEKIRIILEYSQVLGLNIAYSSDDLEKI